MKVNISLEKQSDIRQNKKDTYFEVVKAVNINKD